MLDLADDWVWDFWVVDDDTAPEQAFHLFYLKAPRSLGDPDLRHHHASVGHVVSSDLVTWRHLPDALTPQATPAYDDLATWTGSVVRGDDGVWRMFTSGIARAEGGLVQRIGVSTSPDLLTWTRGPGTLLEPDPRWYAARADDVEETHWRDPFVVRDDGGTWHMYVTAKTPGGRGNGAVGHATSPDLERWEVQPPLDVASGRFDQLEVISLERVEGHWALVFSALGPEMPDARPGDGGVWSVAVEGPGAPVDTRRAVRLTSEQLYVGRTVTDRLGVSHLLAFRHRDDAGAFVGGVTDPLPVRWRSDRTGLQLIDAPEGWLPS